MKLLVSPLVAFLLAPLTACSFHSGDHDTMPGVTASGSGTARSYQVADFTAIDLRGSDDVDVRTGTGFSVRAQGPVAELDKLKIAKDGDTLRVGRVNDMSFHWGSGDHDKVKVYVTMPRLAEARITGSGDMNVDRVEGRRFAAETTGSGDLSVAALTVESADTDVTGSGGITLTGTATHLAARITGTGDIAAEGLKVKDAKVSVMGSGGIKADVTGPADVSVMGSGDIDLGNGAKCTTSKMGSGDVHCGG